MAYSLEITESARDDLDQILGYIVLQLKNPSAARNLYDHIYDLYQNLAAYPEMFSCAKDGRIAAKGFRIASVENYIIAYKVDTTGEKVIIHNVFYGARVYQKLL